MGLLVNIDNGGTLTDFCATDGAQVVRTKTLTTPYDLSKCLFEGLAKLSRVLYGADDVQRLLLATDHIRYSTTQGTNALVERKGPGIGLLLAGVDADALRARPRAAPLHAALVGSRIAQLEPGLDDAALETAATRAVNALAAAGANRIVVGAGGDDPDAVERRLQRVLLRRFPPHLLGALPILYSTQLVHDDDVPRRIWTATLNAFLHPAMERFLYGAEQRLRDYRTRTPLLIFRNDGGASRIARTAAISTYSSGPRGGAEGSRALARQHGLARTIALDIGGTTTDLCLVEAGQVRTQRRGHVAGVEVSIPLADIESVGVGGSSIVRVVDGALRVGPESVGGAPGPACFGLGGTQATITDAFLAGGLLEPATFFGGELALDAARAQDAIAAQVATPLGLSTDDALAAMEDAWVGRVAEAIRGHAELTPDTALAAFGGAGPFVVTAIADRLGVRRVVIPRLAAVFSAFGVGHSDISHDFEAPLAGEDPASIARVHGELLERARRAMFGEGFALEDCEVESWLACADRQIPFTDPRAAQPPAGVRCDAVGVRARRPLPHAASDVVARVAASAATAHGTRRVLSAGARRDLPLYRLEDQCAGAGAAGPAVLEEAYFTCRVDAGWRFEVAGNLDIVLSR